MNDSKVPDDDESFSSSEDEISILLSKEEHQILKNFQPNVVFIPSGNRIADIVIEQTLYLLQPLIQQFEICIIKRIPTLFDLLGK